MKYLLFLLLLTACEMHPLAEQTPAKLVSTVGMYGGNIVKIRNCDYIVSHVYAGYVYTHCGDCTNPIHQKP